MKQYYNMSRISFFFIGLTFFVACKKNDHFPAEKLATKISIENILSSQPLVESGTFAGSGPGSLIQPGESVAIRFSAAKGEALTFVTMYGWSNDLFFAPDNPGIKVYDDKGTPLEGDVSSQIKLWDNGTRINQVPGEAVSHPGTADNQKVTQVDGTDAQGNAYVDGSKLVKATLKYDGNSYFTLTLKNSSGGSKNETPLSPGVWAVSYIVGGSLLNPAPLYSGGQPTANGLTSVAEMGDNMPLADYIRGLTGIFTPLSPVLVVVYDGGENPFFKVGEKDRGEGLKELAQQGNADVLANTLKTRHGVKQVYVLPDPQTKVLLPKINGNRGSIVSQDIKTTPGDRIAIATMYGFSNDWFFASSGNGVNPVKGDISNSIALYDNGSAIDQFPGAGITQFNLQGTPLEDSKPIVAVPNPNPFTTLPEISNFIRVTLE
jgi:hypothetical protein